MHDRLCRRNFRFFFLLPWTPFPLRVLILPFLPSLTAGVYGYMGPRRGLTILGVTLGLAYALYGGGGWSWLLLWAAMGPIFVIAMDRTRTIDRAILTAVLATLGFQVLMLLFRSAKVGEPPSVVVEKGIETAVRRMFLVYENMGVELQTFPPNTASAVARAIAPLTPGAIAAMNLLLYWWTLLVHRWLAVSCGVPAVGPRDLRLWGMPDHLVWGTIMGGVMVILSGHTIGYIGMNILIVMATLHFLQGIGVISSIFHQRGVPQFLRGLFYVLIFFQHIILLCVIILGLFDIWFDFRRRWPPAVKGEEP